MAQTEPTLTRLVNDEVARLRKESTRELPKYVYPYHVLTAAMLQRYSKYGIDYKVRRNECGHLSKLDTQKSSGKAVFGGGLLLSDKAAAERAAAERAAAHVWELSQRERDIVEYINSRAGVSNVDTAEP